MLHVAIEMINSQSTNVCRPRFQRLAPATRWLTARPFGFLFGLRGCAISPWGDMPKNRVLNHQGRSMSSRLDLIPKILSAQLDRGQPGAHRPHPAVCGVPHL